MTTNIEPLKQKYGLTLGAPACTGAPSGFDWLQQFFGNCSGNCSVDFIPLHWYGNFEGLASHVGQYHGAYPNTSLWVTEYADANDDLASTETFFNQSASWFDSLRYVLSRTSSNGLMRSEKLIGTKCCGGLPLWMCQTGFMSRCSPVSRL